MSNFILVPLNLRDTLFNAGVLTQCEQSSKNNGYYIPEKIYLNLKNINVL